MRRLLDAAYLAALLLLSPWLLWRAWRTGRYRQGLRDKLLGFAGEAPAGGVLFHGRSVGGGGAPPGPSGSTGSRSARWCCCGRSSPPSAPAIPTFPSSSPRPPTPA